MKRIISLLAILACVTYSVYGQWLQLTSPSTNNLYSVYFTNSFTGFLSGSTSGVIIKTTDGGNTWAFLNTGTSSAFYDILFLDMNTGFAVGSSGTIVKTTNSGTIWSTRLTGSSTLNSISFPTASTGYAVGGSPTSLYKSIDGGNTWTSIAAPSTNTLRDVFFYTNTNGWVCGYTGTIMETTDGGTSWIPQFQSTSYNFERIYFNSILTGYVIGSGGIIMKTANGGTNWVLSTSSVTTNLYGLTFADVNNGWASGASGKIVHTTDGGNNWYQQTNPSATATYNSISMTSLLLGYIAGSNGILLKTTNGGGQPYVPFFQKITSGPIVTTAASNSECAWADYDNDGFQDLVVMPWDDNCHTCYYPIQLWHNNHDGTFTMANNIITQTVTNAIGCSWGDYDNDGKLDLYIARPLGNTNLLFHNEGNGVFTQVTTGPEVTDFGNNTTCAWCDYDRDGWLDLFVGHQNGEKNCLYHNNGNGTFTKVTNSPIVMEGGSTRSCAWGDWENTGWPNLLVVNFGIQPYMYHNNGNGTFTKITNNIIVNTSMYGSGCQWIDFDNDGKLDLFITCNNQPWKLYHNEGNGVFTLSSLTPPYDNLGYSISPGWGDYDNDGWIDLFLPKHGTNNLLYKNNNGTSFTQVTNEIVANEGGNSEVGIWADYLNNGKLDLFVSNMTVSPNYLYRNVGNTGNYLICKLHGCMPLPGNSNTAGIGARIKIYKGSFFAMREVTSSYGFGSSNMLWPYFGLGTINTLDSLVCYWPSGKIQKLTNVTANQTITIDECLVGITNNQNQFPSKYELKQNYPNPFNPTTMIEYSIMKQTNVKVTVYDIDGNLVRTLVNGIKDAGSYKIEFDGSNIASGIYFYKIETNNFTDFKKMVLMK